MSKRNLWFICTAVSAFLLALAMVINLAPVKGSAITVWTVRFALAALTCFCWGMFARSGVVKSVLISLAAAGAAVCVAEWRLNHNELTRLAEQARRTTRAGVQADASIPYFVVDKDEIVRRAKAKGIPDPETLVSPEEEYDGDPQLGYRAKPREMRISAIKMQGNETIYDVIYSLLPSGWRVTPQHPGATRAVVFFGCSFTFGEGLEDAESFPYKVGVALGEGYQTYNFGFHGYGSHQMLAMIENGYLDDIAAKHQSLQVFYTTVKTHEERSAGKSSWDQVGPRYVIEDGEAVRRGNFPIGKAEDSETQPAINLLGRADNRMIDLHLAILSKADRLLREKFGTRLDILVMPGVPYADNLRKLGFRTIDFPMLSRDEYAIKMDGHPNQAATSVIANAVVDFIGGKGSGADRKRGVGP